MKINSFLMLVSITIVSCNSKTTNVNNADIKTYNPGAFGYDVNFLQQHDSIAILKNEDDSSRVIVSPKYQAKVFTSTAGGDSGLSFGWINYKAFTDSLDKHMNAYGGENRFWLGPEGGVFSLFFDKGKNMVFDTGKLRRHSIVNHGT